jgi:hypothetical protein
MEMGSACPSSQRIGLFSVKYGMDGETEIVFEGESIQAYSCYSPGAVTTCGAGPAEEFSHPVTTAAGLLMGCVKASLYRCPGAYPFAFFTMAYLNLMLDHCYPSGAFSTCETAAAPVLTYITPGYLRSTLTACIRAAAGPSGATPAVQYTCPGIMSTVGTDSVNPLQAPPSATSDIITACHSRQGYFDNGPGIVSDNIDTQTYCYRDVPTHSFTLISSGIADLSGPVAYVSCSAVDVEEGMLMPETADLMQF